MKHWQFYIAILILAFLLVPTYEGNVSVSTPKIANIPEGTYVIKHGNNVCYSTADGIKCDNSFTGTLFIEKLDETRHGIGAYAIRNKRFLYPDSEYCSNEWNRIICNRKNVGGWEVFFITDIGDGFYNIKSKRTNQFCNIINNTFRCITATAGENEKFQIIPVTPDLNVKLFSSLESEVNDQRIEPVQIAFDGLKDEYTTLDDSLSNDKLILADVASRVSNNRTKVRQLNNKHDKLKKKAGEMETRNYQSDVSLLGLQNSYYEIRDVREPGLRSRENQLASYVSTINNNNIPDLNKLSELANNRITKTETVQVPMIDNKERISEFDISELYKKTKIDSNNLNTHTIKGHFPDIKKYNARPI
jgi:hypothetical protein